jgi:hypothetical protein
MYIFNATIFIDWPKFDKFFYHALEILTSPKFDKKNQQEHGRFSKDTSVNALSQALQIM